MSPLFRRLVFEIRQYKSQVAIVAIAGIIFATAYSRLGFVIKGILDAYEHGDSPAIHHVAYWGLSLAFIIAISRYFHIYTMNMVAEKVVNNLRLRTQEKFMHLSIGFHNSFESGSGGMMSRILNDIKVIQDGLRMVADFFREPLLAVLLLANLFYLNWELTLTILIILPVMLWFLRQLSRGIRKYVLSGQENLEQMTSTIKESLDGVRTIQSYNLENLMAKKMSEQSQNYLQLRAKIHARIEIMGPVTEFIATCLIFAIFFYFSSRVAQGHSTAGDVLAYVGMMLMINTPLKKLQESYVRIQETMVAAQRIYSILDDTSVVKASAQPKAFPLHWKTIEYKNISFAYGDKIILDQINLKILRGQKVAFVGESGSGKTSLVNLLPRFFDPREGQIFIDDIPLNEIDLKELRDNIALVSQDTFLFAEGIDKNISASADYDFEKVKKAAQMAHAHDFIMRTENGYQTNVGDRGSLLSGGEKQRLSIARAFYKNAPLLILDEATSALDSTSELEVQKGLDQLLVDRTSLMIAHRLTTVQNCDVIYVMSKGKIISSGEHVDLIKTCDVYKKYWAHQQAH